MGDMELLCNELVTEILIRLPPQSIYKSKCICKRWRLLITEPTFIERLKSLPPLTTGFFYNRFSKVKFLASNSNSLLPIPITTGFFYNIFSHVNFLASSYNVYIDFTFLEANVIDSHNGFLLCYRRTSVHKLPTFFVCNPLTKQCFTLPINPRMPAFLIKAFLYCNDNGDIGDWRLGFKVFHFMCCEYNLIEINIYSSETGEWRRSMVSLTVRDCYSTGIALNGEFVYYWDECSNDLCVFDLKKEVACFTKLPPKSTINYTSFRELGVSAGRVYFIESNMASLRVWVFVDGGKWYLEHSIRTQWLVDQLPKPLDFSQPYFLRPAFHPINKEICLVLKGNRKVFLYNMDTKRIEDMGDFDFSNDLFTLIPYSLPAWMPSFRST